MIAQTRLAYTVSCCRNHKDVVVVKVVVDIIVDAGEASTAQRHADDICAVGAACFDSFDDAGTSSRTRISKTLSNEEGELGGIRVHRSNALTVPSDGTDGSGAMSAVAITVNVPGLSRVFTWNVSIDAVGCIRQIFMAKSVTSIDDADLLRSGGVGRKKG